MFKFIFSHGVYNIPACLVRPLLIFERIDLKPESGYGSIFKQ